ncbi:MAG TPA: hypothetical protein VGO34_11240 [Alphaproteobacteria bacterium]
MKFVPAACLSLSIALAACSSAQNKYEPRRYVAPNKAFSIAMPSPDWLVADDKADARQVFALFAFKGETASFRTYGQCAIEWNLRPDALSAQQFAATAPALAQDHLSEKVWKAEMNFVIRDSELSPEPQGPTFLYVATGRYEGRVTYWIGAIATHGNELVFWDCFEPAGSLGARNRSSVSEIWPGFLTWVASLTRP